MSMKKKVLCVFSLVLYLLVACTILSGKIEEEMMTLVQVEKRTSSKTTGRSMTLSLRAIYTDKQGDHLYEVREGTGWESGQRSYEVPSWGMDPVNGIASLYGTRDYNFVKSASRQPLEGELARIVEEFETANDTYLYYYNPGVPNGLDLPANLEVIAQSENALLVDVTDGTLPFLPHTAKTWTVTTDLSDRVFSLTEAEAFLNQLPIVMVTFMIAASGVLFWVCGCVAGLKKRNGAVWLNTLAACIALIALAVALRQIDLPASLLPSANIFDFAHYQEEFSFIFDSLRELGMTDHSIFQTAAQVKSRCSQFILGAGIITFSILVLEAAYIFRKHSEREKGQAMHRA